VLEDAFAEVTFSLLRSLFQDDWSMRARVEDTLFALCGVPCRLPVSSLLDVAPLLHDRKWRLKAVAGVNDPVVFPESP